MTWTSRSTRPGEPRLSLSIPEMSPVGPEAPRAPRRWPRPGPTLGAIPPAPLLRRPDSENGAGPDYDDTRGLLGNPNDRLTRAPSPGERCRTALALPGSLGAGDWLRPAPGDWLRLAPAPPVRARGADIPERRSALLARPGSLGAAGGPGLASLGATASGRRPPATRAVRNPGIGRDAREPRAVSFSRRRSSSGPLPPCGGGLGWGGLRDGRGSRTPHPTLPHKGGGEEMPARRERNGPAREPNPNGQGVKGKIRLIRNALPTIRPPANRPARAHRLRPSTGGFPLPNIPSSLSPNGPPRFATAFERALP